MADEPIETVTVKLEADYRDFLNQINKAVDESVKKMKAQEDAAKKAAEEGKKGFKGFSDFLEGKFTQVVTQLGAAMAATFAANTVINFFKNIISASVEASSQFEVFETQFTTLLGSASAAKKRIDELATFGQKTPFELDEIVSADRLLQTFGGTALATGENLRRIGDSAAAVNADFKEVSFWTGRMYSAIQAGRPFGEASARLQELGILTGDVRTKLEDMQKTGASGTELWAVYSEMIDTRFTGAMDRLSHTLQGVMSNLADFQAKLLREGGKSFFEGLRGDAIEFYEIISDPEIETAITNLAKAFGEIANSLREATTGPLLAQLADVDPARIDELAASVQDISEAISGIDGASIGGINDFLGALNGATQAVASLVQLADVLKEASLWVSGLKGVEATGLDVKKVILDIVFPVYGVANAFDALNGKIEELTGSSLSEWLGNVDTNMEGLETTGSHTFNQMQESIQKATDDAKELADTAEEVGDAFEKARDKVDGLAQSMADAVSSHDEGITNAQEDFADNIKEIDQDLADKQADIAEKRNDELEDLEKDLAKQRQKIASDTAKALEKLEKDTAKARADINEKAQQDLEKLASETQDSISDAEEEGREKEKRATEDHQRDMRRLQEQYLYDLQGAVTARDARAIVDLRRKNALEKRNKEDDFETDQEREEEALEKRIEDIRENERERREEIKRSQRDQLADLEESEAEKRATIMASQAEQLATLAESEAEKRAAIEESYQEEMARAQEAHDEAVQKELERYAERKTALDEALSARLEAVAKELADEKDITEEGARAILEALNATFGLGGDIDKLMEDFAARRRSTMRVNIEFEQNVGNDQNGTEQDRGTPNERGGMGGPSARRSFAEGGLVDVPAGSSVHAIVHGGEYVLTAQQAAEAMSEKRRIQARGPIFPGDPKPTSGITDEPIRIQISGSAPPGVGNSEVDAIAGVLVQALQDAGVNARR